MVLMRPQKSLKDGVFIGVPTFYLEMGVNVECQGKIFFHVRYRLENYNIGCRLGIIPS